MKPFRLSRRAVLRGAGGVAIGLPLLEIMTPFGRATGAGTTPPKRFIVFFSPNGSIYENWVPTDNGGSFTLSRILAPLAANQQNIVILAGLTNTAALYGPGDDHMRGMGTMLTGIELLPGNTQGGCCAPAGLAGGISVDQAIANQIGASTKFKSLEVGVESTGASGTVYSYTAYADANQALPPDLNPASVFNRAFGSTGMNTTDMQRIQAERKSVLDAVIASYTQLNPKLGSFDRAKLDAHLSNIRDLETRITAPGAGSGTTGATCTQPTAPATIDYNSNDNFPAVGKLQMDLLVAAMACDLTRVGSIQWERSVGGIVFRWVDSTIDRGHHDMSHDADTNADTVEKLTKINIWYAQQLNYLIESLKAIPEGTGTMLDNTLILWCNELARGNVHSHTPMPFVLAGKAGGALTTGRFLQFSGVSHSNMLVSLMNLMGVSATTFGNPKYCTGPLTGL